ncbi:MAG: hypothetical protein R3270_01875 [Gammaproteobacteria bacterium]|nr:hypothetical protein [Gammaproteobacteria bacterium]
MTLLIATIAYLIAVAVIARIEDAHDARTDLTPVQHWLVEEVFHPFLRASALLLFMVAGFHGIFGIGGGAPGYFDILDFELLSRGFNILFILPFLLALLPNSAAFTPLLLPLQTLALTAITWLPLAERAGVEANLLPSPGSLLASLAVIAIGGHLLARHIGRLLPPRLLQRLAGYDLGLLVFQLPLMLAYGRALGAQLPW